MIINDIIEITDKIFQLKNYKKENLQSIYQNLIAPLFNDLILIHSDYIKMFSAVATALSDSTIPIKDVAQQLKIQRLEFEPVRTKVSSLAVQMRYIKEYKELYDFIDKVIIYLPSGKLVEDPSSATQIIDLLDYWSEGQHFFYNGAEVNPRIQLQTIVSNTLGKHRYLWSNLCESYAKFKLSIYK